MFISGTVGPLIKPYDTKHLGFVCIRMEERQSRALLPSCGKMIVARKDFSWISSSWEVSKWLCYWFPVRSLQESKTSLKRKRRRSRETWRRTVKRERAEMRLHHGPQLRLWSKTSGGNSFLALSPTWGKELDLTSLKPFSLEIHWIILLNKTSTRVQCFYLRRRIKLWVNY